MSLPSNAISHWLGANLDSALKSLFMLSLEYSVLWGLDKYHGCWSPGTTESQVISSHCSITWWYSLKSPMWWLHQVFEITLQHPHFQHLQINKWWHNSSHFLHKMSSWHTTYYWHHWPTFVFLVLRVDMTSQLQAKWTRSMLFTWGRIDDWTPSACSTSAPMHAAANAAEITIKAANRIKYCLSSCHHAQNVALAVCTQG